ncbi:MAG: hypothetical protein ACE5H1_08155, partial [Thermodesulfobacteriota bacterium]
FSQIVPLSIIRLLPTWIIISTHPIIASFVYAYECTSYTIFEDNTIKIYTKCCDSDGSCQVYCCQLNY